METYKRKDMVSVFYIRQYSCSAVLKRLIFLVSTNIEGRTLVPETTNSSFKAIKGRTLVPHAKISKSEF